MQTERWVAANPQTKPTDLGRESTERLAATIRRHWWHGNCVSVVSDNITAKSSALAEWVHVGSHYDVQRHQLRFQLEASMPLPISKNSNLHPTLHLSKLLHTSGQISDLGATHEY